MDWFTGIIVFLMIWWTALFAVLPWGLKRDEHGMPSNPKLKKKFWITTLVSAILWVVVFMLIKAEVIDFYAIADQMVAEDRGL